MRWSCAADLRTGINEANDRWRSPGRLIPDEGENAAIVQNCLGGFSGVVERRATTAD